MSIPISSRKIAEVAISLLLAVAIMYWIYKDFPFSQVSQCLQEEVQWGWMALSLVFGIIPQIIRGIRWRMALTPVGENPALRNCLSAVYMSFAASLIIPRIGEISRCATLKKTDGTSFPVALGTVVTERIIDSLLVLLIVSITFLCELPAFYRFLTNIDLDIHSFFATFSITGCIVSLLCTCLIIGGLVLVFPSFPIYEEISGCFPTLFTGIDIHQESTASFTIHYSLYRHLDMLFSAFLSCFLCPSVYQSSRYSCRTALLLHDNHRCTCTHTQWSWSLAFCRQGSIDAVWHLHGPCHHVCTNCPCFTDSAGHSIRSLWIPYTKNHKTLPIC